MDYDKLIERLWNYSPHNNMLSNLRTIRDAAAIETLHTESERLREQVRQLETRSQAERCDAADYDCRELGALRRETAALRERLNTFRGNNYEAN